jgi:hypothetical protein
MTTMTNRLFAEKDTGFKNACKMAAETLFPGDKNLDKVLDFTKKIQTTRQASKFRRGNGIVYKTINNMP